MYDIYCDNVFWRQCTGFIEAIKLAKSQIHLFSTIDVIFKGKINQLRISWSTEKNMIGNHGEVLGYGDCKKYYDKMAEKYGW